MRDQNLRCARRWSLLVVDAMSLLIACALLANSPLAEGCLLRRFCLAGATLEREAMLSTHAWNSAVLSLTEWP